MRLKSIIRDDDWSADFGKGWRWALIDENGNLVICGGGLATYEEADKEANHWRDMIMEKESRNESC